MSAAATSKPPTVKLPSTVVSICSDSVGAVPAQSAACVTLRGVSTVATAAELERFNSVVLDVVPSNCHAQLAGSLPRHRLTSMKVCVVVACSRYSCSSVHSSSTGLHVGSAVQRQQVEPELCSWRPELTPPSADTLAEPCRPTPSPASSLGGPCCCRRRPGPPGVAPKAWSVAATSKPPTVKLPSATMSICSDRIGATVVHWGLCTTLRGVSTPVTTAGPFDSVMLEVAPSN